MEANNKKTDLKKNQKHKQACSTDTIATQSPAWQLLLLHVSCIEGPHIFWLNHLPHFLSYLHIWDRHLVTEISRHHMLCYLNTGRTRQYKDAHNMHSSTICSIKSQSIMSMENVKSPTRIKSESIMPMENVKFPTHTLPNSRIMLKCWHH